jgi:hypothetical protein
MKLFDLRKLAAVSALGLVAVLGTSIAANAQGSWNRGQRNDQRQQQVTKQQNQWEQQRSRAEQDRLRTEQERQAELTRRNSQYNNPPRQVGGGFYNVNPRPVVDHDQRYRVYRNGGWYNTDNRGADLLRQAVKAGYQQGFAAGRADRNSRRGLNWNSSNVYRSGSYGYQSYVDRSQYQYYFQQGFQRGYQDGYNSRYQYGFNNGGSVNILGSIISSILNIQSY